ncbi:DUF2306 domain-containing protein [Stackebrandtia nassauensis]|uniref:Membrane protein (DUF2306) n=1 Tax=Stackebrandtia nassauensis (strain DSM 44728 / CIP 108903 / NRRL B-16338 / NBRC 102104 / LLR-40K-21) TaxID=446470 RepID=D3PZI8_STANL|nr:DUF2306 domain-containing protein [Stackebrandtia nassauensis]ADD41662.1 hypothetical protein Snas_1966 [Stackebrandtia nassauensis DSM 44728]
MIPLWVVCGAFFAWRTPAYLGFTPEASFVALRDNTHYLMLSAHVVLGTVTLTCCCLQLWPWLRQHHPKVHRISGRIYVTAVIPASVLAFVSAVWQDLPVPGRISNMTLSILWLLMTIAGFRMARARRFAEHRRWMIRSFALCISIIANRVWTGIMVVALMPFTDSVYGGDWDAMFMDAALAAVWLSWIVNLLIAEWWIERTRRPRPKPPTGPVTGDGTRPAAVAGHRDTPPVPLSGS